MARNTKRELGNALKKLLSEKPLNRITVKDLVAEANVNRQTFYYNFSDVYALLDWVIDEELHQVLDLPPTVENWQDCAIKLLRCLSDNSSLTINVFHSFSRDQLELYLISALEPIFSAILTSQSQGLRISATDQVMILRLYTHAFASLTLDWIRGGMESDPAEDIAELHRLLHGTLRHILEQCAASES